MGVMRAGEPSSSAPRAERETAPFGGSRLDAGVSPTEDEAERLLWRGRRAAAWAFGVYVAVAAALLAWMGSYRWFLGDEWTFLTDRSVTVHDLLENHNGHWATLPVLVYRGLYSLFALHTYRPYQLVVIALHLTTAVLLRVIMRRAGVGPWIATICAGSFVLLGPAEDNILWAFQIGFTGAVVLGLAQLLLADHDGPIDRRDWLGLGAGLLALMTNGLAIALIVGTGLVCLIRRRWWAAAFHTVPLGLLYIVWFFATRVELSNPTPGTDFTPVEYVRWMRDAGVALFTGLGAFAPIALALVALLMIGVVTAARVEGVDGLLRRAAIPAALLVAATLLMTMAAPTRFSFGVEPAKAGRYLGLTASMTLPALAVAADAVARRWRWAAAPVVLLFLVPIPFNAVKFGDDPILSPAAFAALRTYTAKLPENPLTREVPPWVRPNQFGGQPDMTTGWLLEADRRGELPHVDREMHPLAAQIVPIQLGVATQRDGSAEGLTCEDHATPLAVDPSVGDRWYLATPAQIAGRNREQPTTIWLQFERTGVEVTLPDLHLLIAPAPGENAFRLCR
jgi:hypothetical protein